MITIKCEKCYKNITKPNYNRHFKSCNGLVEEKGLFVDENWKNNNGKYNCPFCYKEFAKKGISSHIWRMHDEHGQKHVPGFIKGRDAWNKGLTAKTNEKIKLACEKSTITLKERYKNGELISPFLGKHHSEKTKKILSELMSERLKIPENRKNYGRGKRSWMEIKFIEYLYKENITGWCDEVHFWNEKLNKNYFVDFLFEDKKLIIELDGTQHKKIIELDRIRDEYMNSLGYTVKRITHKEFIERIFHNGFLDILPQTDTDVKNNKEFKKCSLCGDTIKSNISELCFDCYANIKRISKDAKEKNIKEKKIYICDCGKEKSKNSKMCIDCKRINERKVKERPSKEVLLQDIKELGYCGTGRKYGVSDKAIRKWVKRY